MNNLNTKIRELSKNGNQESMFEIERLLNNALQQDPFNIDILLKLALLEFHPPFMNHEKSISILEKILSIDPMNTSALLLLACVNYYSIGSIDQSLFKKLTTARTGNTEIDSMFKYTAAWFYDNYDDNENENNLENLLVESINICQSHVNNYQKLAKLYLKQNKFLEAKMLIKKALKNVKKIYTDNEGYADDTDVQEFFNERIKGIFLTYIGFSHLRRLEEELY